MSYGAVPIVYDSGGQRDVVSEGLGARWSTLSDLVETTVQFIDDRDLRDQVARRAAASTERFSYERFRKDLRAIVDSAMKATA
jgi:glycosyltransferase involved in cell wall biosynthesis